MYQMPVLKKHFTSRYFSNTTQREKIDILDRYILVLAEAAPHRSSFKKSCFQKFC